jgi:hypothetical protein
VSRCYVRSYEFDVARFDRQYALFELHLMDSGMSFLKLFAILQPHARDIDEIYIFCDQCAERRHIVAIPGILKTQGDLLYSLSIAGTHSCFCYCKLANQSYCG